MNFLRYFAHGSESATAASTTSSFGNFLQDPLAAWLLVSALALALMLGALWLIKRYTHWHVTTNKKANR